MEYSNKTVYNFLIEECKTKPALWAEFGTGLTERTCEADFWESLSEELDCFRICEECGQPMIEGFVVDGCQTYCSEECLHKHISEEDYREAYNDGEGDTYWTTWYEDSNTLDINKANSYDKNDYNRLHCEREIVSLHLRNINTIRHISRL